MLCILILAPFLLPGSVFAPTLALLVALYVLARLVRSAIFGWRTGVVASVAVLAMVSAVVHGGSVVAAGGRMLNSTALALVVISGMSTSPQNFLRGAGFLWLPLAVNSIMAVWGMPPPGVLSPDEMAASVGLFGHIQGHVATIFFCLALILLRELVVHGRLTLRVKLLTFAAAASIFLANPPWGRGPSATGRVAVVVFALPLALFGIRHHLWPKIVSLRLVILFTGLVPLAMSTALRWPITQQFITQALGRDVTLTGRTDIWGSAIDQFLRNPVLGIGLAGFDEFAIPGITWRVHSAHNFYLQQALTGGILLLGITLFALLRACSELEKYRGSPVSRVLTACLGAMLVASIAETGRGLVLPITLLATYTSVVDGLLRSIPAGRRKLGRSRLARLRNESARRLGGSNGYAGYCG